MFQLLREINRRPEPFEFYTTEELWTNEHTAQKMLEYHLNENVDAASRNHAFIKRSVNWIARCFNVETGSEVADFGCGPGLYANGLAEFGAHVTGIDFSENSLEYARGIAAKKGLNVDYINADYLGFQSGRGFDLIIMIMCDFCVLSPAQRASMLDKFASFLKPGGKVLLDVHSLGYFKQKREEALYEKNQLFGFWSAEDYYGFVNTFKYDSEKLILDKYTIVEPARTRHVYNWAQCYSPDTLKALFKEHGLAVTELYDNVAGDRHTGGTSEFAVVAEKL